MTNHYLCKMLYNICILSIIFVISASAQNQSTSEGTPKSGSMKNAWRLPRRGPNFIYFSKYSYYILKNSHTNSKVYQTVIDTYDQLYELHPERKYVLMECANKKGGKMTFHRTHQNGMSIDFMSPLVKKGEPKYYKGLGFFRYLMNFDANGCKRNNHKVRIDFDGITEHIYYLEKNARKNGLKISKVIFKINLKEQLLATEYGRKLKSMNIYFVQKLPKLVDNAHDDHYHVDFEELK